MYGFEFAYATNLLLDSQFMQTCLKRKQGHRHPNASMQQNTENILVCLIANVLCKFGTFTQDLFISQGS